MNEATAAEIELVRAVTAHPAEQTPRDALQDELQGSGRWTWDVVYGNILYDPASDGLRLLAADYLETTPPEPCKLCKGIGAVCVAPYQTASKRCPACLGLKHDARYRANRAAVIRASIALEGLQAEARRYWSEHTTPPKCWHILPAQCVECRDLHTAIQFTRTDNDQLKAIQDFTLDAAADDRGFVGAITTDAWNWVKAANPPVTAGLLPITSTYPVTAVTLTTWPEVRTTRGSRRHHMGRERARIVGMSWVNEADLLKLDTQHPNYPTITVDGADRVIALQLTRHYWPRISFHMPAVEDTNTPHGVLDQPAPNWATWDTPESNG